MNEKVIALGAFHPVPSFLFLMSLIVVAVFIANPVAVGILLRRDTGEKILLGYRILSRALHPALACKSSLFS